MSPPVFRSSEWHEAGSQLALMGDEARHAIGSMRIRIGEPIDIVDGRGRRAHATVSNIERPDRLMCDIVSVLVEAQPRPAVTVVQALIKDGERAVDLLTQAGADRIIPWAAERCVVHWRGDRAAKARTKWQRAADQAAKQCRRAWWPTVGRVHSTAEVLTLLESQSCIWILDAQGTERVSDTAHDADLCVIVGPEGDFTPAESAAFRAVGAHSVHLGPQVWRSATAGMAALTMAVALRGRLTG